MAQNSALSHVGLIKEVTVGSYLAPTIYLPTDGQPTPSDDMERIIDESYDANRSKVRGIYDGVHDGSIGWSSMFYPDAIGTLLRGLGYVDVVTGSGPFLHTFKLPASNAQPVSFSITDFDTVEARGWPGQMIDTMAVKVDTKGAAKYDVAMKGFPSAPQSTPTPSFTSSAPWLSWNAQLSLAGSTSNKGLTAEIDFNQGAETIHTLQNSQSPLTTYAGSLDVGVKFRAIYDATTEIARHRGNTQVATALTLTHPVSPNVITFTSTVNGYITAKVDRSGTYVVVDLDTTGIFNATDAGPMQVTISNSVAAAY